MIKKSLSEVLTACIVLSAVLVSCSSDPDNSEVYENSNIQQTEYIEEEKEESLYESNVSDADLERYKDLISFPYFSAMKKRNFILEYFLADQKITQKICMDGEKIYSSFADPGISYQMIYDISDNKQYMIIDDKYCETALSDTAQNLIMIYSDLEYISEGNQNYNGENCRYDQFEQTGLGTSIKFIIDSNGEFKAFDQSGTVAEIKLFKSSADKALFEIPENYDKVSENELSEILEKKISSHFG